LVSIFFGGTWMAEGSAEVSRYDIVWDSPSVDSSGSMPIGNGDIGANVWMEKNGDLVFYLSKTDSINENAALLKLGRVRISLSPSPIGNGADFQQKLNLARSVIEIAMGKTKIRVWADANYPCINVEVDSPSKTCVKVALEVWRKKPRVLTGIEAHAAYGLSVGKDPVVVSPDSILSASASSLSWYHRNNKSTWVTSLVHQGLGEWMSKAKDPLMHLTFGGLITGENLKAASDEVLESKTPANHHRVSVYALTAQTESPEQWKSQIDAIAAKGEKRDVSSARADHERWWKRFWNRSWINVTGDKVIRNRGIEPNDLPLRIGANSEGGNLFAGKIRVARIYDRALSAEDIKSLSQSQKIAPAPIADWDMSEGASVIVKSTNHLEGKIVGELSFGRDSVGGFAQFGGKGWIEVADSPKLDTTRQITLEAWVCPDSLPPDGMRIIDKSKAGTTNGYLLDTFPGSSIRMIVKDGTLIGPDAFKAGVWSHVAAVFDGDGNTQAVFVNGQMAAGGATYPGSRPCTVSEGYTLQRYITACSGRGGKPIKFNGSIFTVDSREPGLALDADFRLWGGPYWFQNTRLAYWPMLATGDFEMLKPWFKMYRDALPFAEWRTPIWYGHEGAFFPETMYFWGTYTNDDYSWERANEPVGQVNNTFIRWYWSGALELISVMLDYVDYSGDTAFVKDTLLPIADGVFKFYDKHYPRDAKGKLLIKPAAALESWQDCANPAPEIAGLRWTLPKLLNLSETITGEDRRSFWKRLLSEIPELPIEIKDGRRLLIAAGENYGPRGNVENPELYAIFPYRHFGVGKPDLEIARETFNSREIKECKGWTQDDTQATFLGLAKEASEFVSQRFANHHAGSRFPAFWGPNYDWIPDQDHGANGEKALQTMLLQADDGKIRLFPAWPKGWDVEFKLHAPQQTTVECGYSGGKVQKLKVTPAKRLSDVIVIDPQ
ncbi:MAG: DUF5703 domain-containing protein, partial [Armatimonadota bacterium]